MKTNLMIRPALKLLIIATLPTFLQSCATILNKPSQPVTITTGQQEAVLYLNGEVAGHGSTALLELPRVLEAQQIRVSSPGYLDVHAAHAQHKMSPWFIMSIIPFGVLIVPPMLDSGKKAYDYDRTRSLMPATPRVLRKKEQRSITLRDIQVKLGETDVKLTGLSYREWEDEERELLGEPFDTGKPFEPDEELITEAVRGLLSDNGFGLNPAQSRPGSNTLRSLAGKLNKVEGYKISANISELRVRPEFCVAKVEMTWRLSATDESLLTSLSTMAQSGEFSVNQYGLEQAMQMAVSDAANRSLNRFLGSENVQRALNRLEPTKTEPQTIRIPTSRNPPENLGQATEAVATFFHSNGHGSGILISEQGHMLSCASYIGRWDSIRVRGTFGEALAVFPLRTDEELDLALVKLPVDSTRGFRLSAPMLSLGSTVFALGIPAEAELGPTLEKGIVSGTVNVNGHAWIVTDMKDLPTYNGGALLDEQGRLIGLLTNRVPGLNAEGRVYGIPIRAVAEKLGIEKE